MAVRSLVPKTATHVQAEPLAVAPQVLGLPLGTPLRRALALGIDLWIVGLLSVTSLWWLALGIVVLAVVVRLAMRAEGIAHRHADALAAVMVALALAVAGQAWRAPTATEPVRAEKRLRAPATADGEGPRSDAERIAELETELARAHAAKESRRPDGWRERLGGMFDEIGLGFGWGIVYFSLLPAYWQGQTVGKRLLRLRIVELSGRRLTPLRGLKRYGGYVAGMATGGLGLAQILWEPNRQALHDKAAHTVVVDTRPQRPPVMPRPPAEEPECKPNSTSA
jgi:RDD family